MSSQLVGRTIWTAVNRIFVPLALLAICLGAFYGSNRLGNDPVVEPLFEPHTAAEVPLLSARRLPEFLTVPIANEQLAVELEAVYAESIAGTGGLTCMSVYRGDEVLFEQQPQPTFTPASTLKIQTAVAALLKLGPDFTFTTSVYADEAPVDGTVNNLYLVGGGDPVLMTADYARSFDGLTPEFYTDVDELANGVLAEGVRQINGGVLSISRLYDEVRYVPTWPERFATQGQAGPMSSLMINDAFTSWPETPNDREFADQLGVATNEDPAVHAAAFFDDLLEAREVIPARGQREADPSINTDNLFMITSVTSPPMRTIVAQMLRFSDNTTAELLTKQLGVAQTGEGSTAAGTSAIVGILSSAGLDGFDLPPLDGSGLDGANKMTCPQLTTLLQFPDTRPWLEEALPVAGESGTIADRFRNTSAEGNLRAKTGSLLNVTALAGYIESSDGDPMTFAYIANRGVDQQIPADFKELQEPLASSLANYPVGPDVAEIAPPGEDIPPSESLDFGQDANDDVNPDADAADSDTADSTDGEG